MSVEKTAETTTPTTPAAPKTTANPAVVVATQQQQQQVALSAMAHMNDVLLGDEMSMMGCDVDAWSTAAAARPHFVAAQPQPAAAYFACPPANLTRHVSLPVSMMRQDIHYPAAVHFAPAPGTPAHAVPLQAMPPVLVRHHSHGYIMSPHHPHHPHHQAPVHHFHHQLARPVNAAQMHQMLELSISHQHHPQQAHAMKNEAFAPLAADLSVEPMPFTSAADGSKLSMDDNFDLEPLTYAVFGASERPKNLQQLESAIESLDRLLPDLAHDVFQQQQMQVQMVAAPQGTLITPRNVVYGRAALPLLLSPQGKENANSPASSSAMAFSTMMLSNHTPKSARNMAVCKVGGCDRRVRSKGFCKTHGGGRKCNIEGCKKSSQNGDFCIGHGGGKKCKEDGCAKAAQSHGLCKAHGGGARCKFPDCNKSSQGGGLCRAHGGGKRCQASGCPKGAQRGNFCATHGGFRNCKIDGCVRTDRGGGFCEVHRRGRLCKIEGCKKLSRNQGMCTMHIREEKQEGGVDEDVDDSLDCFRHSLIEA